MKEDAEKVKFTHLIMLRKILSKIDSKWDLRCCLVSLGLPFMGGPGRISGGRGHS